MAAAAAAAAAVTAAFLNIEPDLILHSSSPVICKYRVLDCFVHLFFFFFQKFVITLSDLFREFSDYLTDLFCPTVFCFSFKSLHIT